MARIKPGKTFGGDYVVVRELARGGFGAVFVAMQSSTGRERALKVMHPQIVDDEKARERFLREAKIGASIPSTHVVEVLASGVDTEDDTPWLVMELLQGETLAQRLERVGRLSPRETLTVLEQAGHALREAHARGIFHLDLKPENLFLARSQSARGEDETLKVLDFGIARTPCSRRAWARPAGSRRSSAAKGAGSRCAPTCGPSGSSRFGSSPDTSSGTRRATHPTTWRPFSWR